MSLLYYLASDSILEERLNPYWKSFSVNEAMQLGVITTPVICSEGFDKDKPDTILYCHDSTKMGYPDIRLSEKTEFFDDIGTLKKHIAVLDWEDHSYENAGVILDYITDQMKTSEELELWHIWLGENNIIERTEKSMCSIDELSIEKILDFYDDKFVYECLTVTK